MAREADLEWFESNRQALAAEFRGRFLVVLGGAVRGSFPTEEEAVVFSVEKFGLEAASVFHAVLKDPIIYIGGGGLPWAG
jgi:hypothetical protein